MKIATLLRTIENEHAIQALYRMEPPLDGHDLVLASGIRTRLAHECFLFASDESGEITDWTELSGVRDTCRLLPRNLWSLPMTDRLDTIRKRLASGSPFGAYGTDLVWALDEIERLTKKANESHAALRTVAHAVGVCHCWDFGCEPGPTADIVAAIEDLKRCEIREMDRDAAEYERLEKLAQSAFVLDPHVPMVRAEIARLDALSRATADEMVTCFECGFVGPRECTCTATDDPEDVIACHVCGRVECECGVGADEENCA